MLAEEELTQIETVQQAVNYVKHEAEARHVAAVIPLGQAEERRGDYYTFLMIPVEMPALATDEFLRLLGKIQNKWNDQEPRPEKLLFLYPAGVPRHAV